MTFFNFEKLSLTLIFLLLFFNAAIDKTDMITAKKVRHTCSLVLCVKCRVCNKALLSTFHFLLTSSLLQLLTVMITLLVRGEVSSSRFHPLIVQATCFLLLLFALPSSSTPRKLQQQIKTAYISTEEYHSLGCQSFVISNSANRMHLIVGVSTANVFVTIVLGSLTMGFDLQQNVSLAG